MDSAQADVSTSRKPLRLWPGVVIVILQWLTRFVLPVVAPDFLVPAIFGGLIGGVALIIWWLFFSRAPWPERVGVVALMVVAIFATRFILHVSILTGSMGMLFPVLVIPILSLAFVASLVASRHLSEKTRRVSMAAAILLACGAFALVRTGGFTGTMDNDLAWRWSPTPEERMLATEREEPPAPPSLPKAAETPAQALPAPASAAPAATASAPAAATPVVAPTGDEPRIQTAAAAEAKALADWPGFRGPRRDGIVRGVKIATDWTASPPVEMWRRPIGPAWSSFAVDGNLLYTQEQRGDDEVVSAYSVTSGQPVWRHRDKTRFYESNGGAGPRGTPTLQGGRVYALGATGILNALDARTGALVWSRNAASDTTTKVPGWGFSASPLVVDDLVIVATAGTLAAYDAATGNPRWIGPKRRSDYSSPHLATIDGTTQILLLSGTGITSVVPSDGKVLWEHALPSGTRIVQPALTADGDVLMSNGEFGDGNGMHRVAITRGSTGWTSQERWTSTGLKPNFNDYVVHKGHAFGFDGSILACIDLADGTRKWKGGRYGMGQLILLADQDLLLVLAEEGDLALVRATPEQFTELARIPAIKGKTWNHPVLVRDVLLVRNAEEMAAFRLALAGR